MIDTYLLVLATVSAMAIHHVKADMEKYVFTAAEVQKYGSRCLDGSPSGFYLEKGDYSTGWIFFMEGGGLCTTEQRCTERAKGPLGSSTQWKDTQAGFGLLSRNSTENTFYQWNHVVIPYCSGDLHSGQRRAVGDWGVYFAGHLTVEAVLQHLTEERGLGNAERVILSGGSAGGIGAFEHVDFFADMLPQAQVRATPQGGYFFPGNPRNFSEFMAGRPAASRNDSLRGIHDLYNASVDTSCRAANPSAPFLCGPSHVDFLMPYISSLVYVAENQFESNQIFSHMGCPHEREPDVIHYVKYYGQAMMTAINQHVIHSKLGHGLYLPPCLSHVGDLRTPYSSPPIQGATYAQSFDAWYYQSSKFPYVVYENRTLPNCGAV